MSAALDEMPLATTNDRAALRQWYALGVLLLAYVANFGAMTTINVLVEPIKRAFGLSDAEMGTIVGIAYAAGFALASLPAGMLTDRVNRRNLTAAAMTLAGLGSALSGMFGSYAGLLLARVGVGAAHAGGNPTALTMIPDMFPPTQRSTAIGIYFLGIPVGMLTMFPLGSFVAEHYGWQAALVVAGLPSIGIAALMLLTVPEPRRGHMDGRAVEADAPPVASALRFIGSQRSAVWLVAGISLSNLTSGAAISWLSSLYIRNYHMPLQDVGITMALGFGVCGGIGSFLGGVVSDHLGKRDVRWQVRVTSLATLGVLIFGAAMVTMQDLRLAVGFMAIWSLCGNVQFGPVYGLCQGLVPTRMRGTMSALLGILGMVVGYGLGAQVTGLLSQALAPVLGDESVRYALLAVDLLNLPVLACYLLATRRLKADLARV